MTERRTIAAVLDEALDLGLKGEERWFRAGVSHGLELSSGQPMIDHTNGVIYGYSVITQGPALGHDMHVDQMTMDQVVHLGNQSAMGIKSRFDHPNASNTSMGTFLGRSKNFRKVGTRVFADLHLSESAKDAPQGDLYKYILGLAQRDPQAFGASIVFKGKAEQQLNEDGTQKKDANGKALPALARIDQLLASDVVDDPAANPDGLFHRDADTSLATKLTAFLNRWAVNDFLPRFQAVTAIHKEDSMSKEEQKPSEAAPVQTDGLAAALAEGRKQERARVTGVLSAMLPGQEAMAKELIEVGATVEEATRAFKISKLTTIQNAAPASAGGAEDKPAVTATDLSMLSIPERCKIEWETNKDGVREEFTSQKAYEAFCKADARGAIKQFVNTKSAA